MRVITVLKCPFCGEELEVVGKGHYFAHKINGCILQHLCFEIDDEEAVALWNTRKPAEEVVARLKETREGFSGGTMQWYYYYNGITDAIEIVKEGMG